ncbi:MAG: hypothetical protein ABR551_02925 [Gemmatimonadales bacterium]
MKATIDIPDDLYRQVKARSALEGRTVREVTTELYQKWLAATPAPDPEEARRWLERWTALADEFLADAPPGPTTREILDEDRNRLERR